MFYLLGIDRVCCTKSNGKNFRFKAYGVLGDGHNSIAYGFRKSSKAKRAISNVKGYLNNKAVEVAFKANGTFPRDYIKYNKGFKMIFKKGKAGMGLVCSPVVFKILEYAGYTDGLVKVVGRPNRHLMVSTLLEVLCKVK